jgi:hypothetical protein
MSFMTVFDLRHRDKQELEFIKKLLSGYYIYINVKKDNFSTTNVQPYETDFYET